MGKGHRTGRLGEEIRKIISEMLISGIKDPRVAEAMVSISAVEVTNDGSYATCFVTILTPSTNSDEEVEKIQQDVLDGLYSAKGLIKKEIGRKIKLRHIPELIFKLDTSMDYGRHITEVLKGLDIKDEEQ